MCLVISSSLFLSLSVCVCVCVCVFVDVQTYSYLCMSDLIYVFISVYVFVFIYLCHCLPITRYIHKHTTHTHTDANRIPLPKHLYQTLCYSQSMTMRRIFEIIGQSGTDHVISQLTPVSTSGHLVEYIGQYCNHKIIQISRLVAIV